MLAVYSLVLSNKDCAAYTSTVHNVKGTTILTDSYCTVILEGHLGDSFVWELLHADDIEWPVHPRGYLECFSLNSRTFCYLWRWSWAKDQTLLLGLYNVNRCLQSLHRGCCAFFRSSKNLHFSHLQPANNRHYRRAERASTFWLKETECSTATTLQFATCYSRTNTCFILF